MNSLGHERIFGLIIFVVTDQVHVSYTAHLRDVENIELVKVHDAFLSIRNKMVTYATEIEGWIDQNSIYVRNPDSVMNQDYYDMVADALGIIYLEDYANKPKEAAEYAKSCIQKYTNWRKEG